MQRGPLIEKPRLLLRAYQIARVLSGGNTRDSMLFSIASLLLLTDLRQAALRT